MKRSKKLSLIFMVLVLLIGIGSSIDLTYIHFKVTTSGGDYKSFCNINDTINCDTVALSPWARMLGVPISILGCLTYLSILGLALVRLRKTWREKFRSADVYLWLAGLGCVGYSVFLAWICYAEIGSWCIMCMVLYAVNTAIFLTAWISKETPFAEFFSSLMNDLRWALADWKRITAFATLALGVIAMFSTGAYLDHKKKLAQLEEVMSKLTDLDTPAELTGDVIGNPDGEVVIIMFSDYQCPFCARMDLELVKLTQKYDNLKILHRDFPLDQACNPMVTRPYHQFACEAARYKICAGDQGKLFEFHHHLLENRSSISKEFLDASVKSLGLDQEKLSACLGSTETRYHLRKDIQAGLKLELKGTPTLIFDQGRKMALGGISVEEIERIVQIHGNR